MRRKTYVRKTEPIPTIWGNIGAKGDLVEETVGNRTPWFLKQGRGWNAVMTLWGALPVGISDIPAFRERTTGGHLMPWQQVSNVLTRPYRTYHIFQVMTIWGVMPLMVTAKPNRSYRDVSGTGRDLCLRERP